MQVLRMGAESGGKSAEVIALGDYVVFHLSSGAWTYARVDRSSRVRLNGRKFDTTSLVGLPWGLAVELHSRRGIVIPLVAASSADASETSKEQKQRGISIPQHDPDHGGAVSQREDADGSDVGSEKDDEEIEMEDEEGEAEAEAENPRAMKSVESEAAVETRPRKRAARDNRDIVDDQRNQARTHGEISAMLKSGVPGAEIVTELVAGSATFAHKSEYAQAKYLQKKRQKFAFRVRLLRPTARALCHVYFHRNAAQTLNMRADALALMLTMANVRTDAQFAVMDHTTGLLTAALLERMAGRGRILSAFHGKDPYQLEITRALPLSPSHRAILHHIPLHLIDALLPHSPSHQPLADECDGCPISYSLDKCSDWRHSRLAAATTATAATTVATTATAATASATAATAVSVPANKQQDARSELQQTEERLELGESLDGDVEERREALRSARLGKRPSRGTVRAWLRAGCDGLLVALRHDLIPAVDVLLRAVAPCGTVVAYSQFLQPAAELQHALTKSGLVSRLQLNEVTLQNHQVIPGRTHPTMNEYASSGYVLTAVKIDRNTR